MDLTFIHEEASTGFVWFPVVEGKIDRRFGGLTTEEEVVEIYQPRVDEYNKETGGTMKIVFL